MTYVYLLIGGRDRPETIKIGRTWNVRLRMTNLKRQKQGMPLTLIGYIPVHNPDIDRTEFWDSHKLEQGFHNRIRGNRYRGEWHPFNPETVSLFLKSEGAVVCL